MAEQSQNQIIWEEKSAANSQLPWAVILLLATASFCLGVAWFGPGTYKTAFISVAFISAIFATLVSLIFIYYRALAVKVTMQGIFTSNDKRQNTCQWDDIQEIVIPAHIKGFDRIAYIIGNYDMGSKSTTVSIKLANKKFPFYITISAVNGFKNAIIDANYGHLIRSL